MQNLHYKLHLEPDLETFIFQGTTTIKFSSEEELKEISLNAKELGIFSCEFLKDEKKEKCTFMVNPEKEELLINFKKAKQGDIQIEIKYHGIINANMLGFYRSKYETKDGVKYNAVTQFEEREARQAFPGFDHPSKKATFDIEFVIDENLKGIANTPIVEERSLENGKKLIIFEQTPRMSTYLLFFGVGDYCFIEDTSKFPHIRAVAVADKIEYGQFGMEFGRKSMDWLEDYTGIPFPIKKCDYIAVSDFAFGAMENYGAITFRENALLVYPGKTSKPQLNRIADVIAHETAHMWFGNLVSPKDWKYIWLNESFASYFTVAVPNAYYPEWKLWDQFTLSSTLDGLERDSLVDTIPVELPGDESATIDFSTAPIIYNKGAAIIRMLVGYLGAEKFKTGVNYFLKKYEFECANSEEYWEAFEKATQEPIKEFADSWVHQRGFPMITVERSGNECTLTQERFTYLPNDEDSKWLIPINIQYYSEYGEIQNEKVVMKDKTQSITLPDGVHSLKLNADQDSFYRVKYSESILESQGKIISSKKMPHMDRFGVENDLFAFVKKGDYTIEQYLDILEKYYSTEEADLVLIDIARNLGTLYNIKENFAERIQKFGISLFERKLELLGYEPQTDDSLQGASLRNTSLWLLFKLGSKQVREFGVKKFNMLLAGETVHPDILGSVLQIGSVAVPEGKEYLLRMLISSETPEMQKLSALSALGCSDKRENLEQFLKLGFDQVPPKNRVQVLATIAGNKFAIPWLWQWFTDNFSTILSGMPIFHVGMAIPLIVRYAGIGHDDDVKKFISEKVKEFPMFDATAKMGLEMLEIYSKIH